MFRKLFRASSWWALVSVTLALGAFGFAEQTPKSHDGSGGKPAVASSIKAESNLVLVPVFVYTHNGLERRRNANEDRCVQDDDSRFFALSAEQPYLPRECWEDNVKGLTLNDFQVFQDGEPQKIENVAKERWLLAVRDNRTWHGETSIAPSGIWSSADLDHFISPDPGGTSSFYLLGYTPRLSEKGCHRIRVEVHSQKVHVFARDEYCGGQTPSDLLNGTKFGKTLEHELAQRGEGQIPLFVQAGAFGSVASRRLTDVVIEFPWNQLNHSWDSHDGKLNANIGVLGAVYAKDGKLITRFSDLLWPSYWPIIIRGWQPAGLTKIGGDNDPYATYSDATAQTLLSRWDPAWLPSRYETQFELPPGEYEIRVILSDGTKVGGATVPVVVENYDGKDLALSSVMLCKRFRDAHVAATEGAAADFAPQYVPMVSKGIQVSPTGDTRFGPGELLIPYFEVHEPQASADPIPRVQLHLKIVDAKTGQAVKDFPAVDATPYAQPGSTTIPIAREVPIVALPKGSYRLEVQASDSAGRSTPWRAANFTITDKN